MRRREAIVALLALGAPTRPVIGQQRRQAKVGFLYFASRKSAIDSRRYPAFLNGMAEHGYVEGKDFTVEARFADGKADRLPALAGELVRAGVDVIVAGGNAAINAAHRATKSVPIIIAQSPDPVAQGWAASLARPGGNITGLISLASEIELKMVEFLLAVVPSLARLAVLSNPTNRTHAERVNVIRAAGKKSGAALIAVRAQSPEEIERAFETLSQERAQALIVLGDTYFLSQARLIATLALKNRLPSTHTIPDYAELGGLIAYGPDIPDNFRRAARYVDKVLKGANPGELPIEQPSRFELTINMKTAQALGVAIPKTLQFQANRLIQ